MEINAMPFTYNTGVVTQKQFDDHMTLYHGYIEKTNEITQKLIKDPQYATANATASHYRGWKRGETYAIDGVILHELYFQNLGNEGGSPGPNMQQLVDRYFGGFDKWKEDFIACATAARGWCILVYEQRTKTCRNILLDNHHDGHIASAYPILVLDMYEHAYFLDYGTNKGAYINKFIEQIPWDAVEKRAGAVI